MPRVRRLTPPGRSAIAVVLLEGEDAAAFLTARGAAPLPPPGRFGLRELELLPGLRDTALVVPLAPNAFEVHLHGNPLLVDALAETGVEGGGPGSLRDEILAAAAAAPTRLGARWALAQLGERGFLGLVDQLAALRRPDLGVRCAAALTAGHALAPLYRPPRVVLRGFVNAGKSTLFNLLVGRDRVRTGPERALTRDEVEELVPCAGWPIRLVDTAGEGEARSEIDRLALAQAHAAARTSELVVWVAAASDPEPQPEPRSGVVRLWTHADRAAPPATAKGEPAVDLSGSERAELRSRLTRWLRDRLDLQEPSTAAAWLTSRQRELLERAASALDRGDSVAVRAAAEELLHPEG